MITVKGRLICASEAGAEIVQQHLAAHIALTRQEPGCLSFAVWQEDAALVWQVEEAFRDVASFRAHQARVAASLWGQATAGIRRDYQIEGL